MTVTTLEALATALLSKAEEQHPASSEFERGKYLAYAEASTLLKEYLAARARIENQGAAMAADRMYSDDKRALNAQIAAHSSRIFELERGLKLTTAACDQARSQRDEQANRVKAVEAELETLQHAHADVCDAMNTYSARLAAVVRFLEGQGYAPDEIAKALATPAQPSVCATCGKLATCHGSYEGSEPAFACDECCGHGCEDGRCERV